MAKIKKKGTTGATKNYYTRSQAVRKLQIPLSDFRRLCIFKGIYPREPRSKKRVSASSTPSTTFYYAKDIHYLLHEPLLQKFREQKALAKKIGKALGRGDVGDARRWERDLYPRLRLDHVVKERYPSFGDAVRDLDDALSLLFLFAGLPSTAEVPAPMIARCQRLTLEFEHYVIRTSSLRKSFLSIKGIYYQARIQGTDVLWLVPYKFVQRASEDVDFRIMATFVEFYACLLGFVNFRLFTGIGLVYPPRFEREEEEKGAELGAFRLEGRRGGESGGSEGEGREIPGLLAENGDGSGYERAQEEADRLGAVPSEGAAADDDDGLTTSENDAREGEEPQPPSTTTLDHFAPIDPKADTLLQPSLTADSSVASHLFEPFTFFLSRETPRHPLEFILRSFGCKRVGWDSTLGEPGAFCEESDERITHQVVDRPDVPLSHPSPANGDDDDEENANTTNSRSRINERVPGRTYIQPQWVWDSINAGQLQRADLYAPGATLPPHLSPWVKAKKGEYDPTVSLREQETVEEAEIAAAAAGDDEEEVVLEDDEIEGSGGEEVQGVRGDGEVREMEEKLNVAEDEDEDGGMDVQLALSEDEDEDSADDINGRDNDNDDWAGLSESDPDLSAAEEEETTSSARQAQAELEAEALGQRIPEMQREPGALKAAAAKQAAATRGKKKKERAEREEKEDVERRKMMMPRRKRKMYEKMVFSNARRDEEAEKLRGKRRRIERMGK